MGFVKVQFTNLENSFLYKASNSSVKKVVQLFTPMFDVCLKNECQNDGRGGFMLLTVP